VIFKYFSPKNKQRVYDAIKAVLVAVLITAGGTVVTSVNNYYTNNLTEKRQIAADARKEASNIARKITNKMNDRYIYSLRLASAYNWQMDQDQRYNEYNEAVKRWNCELIMDLVDLHRYFGKDARERVFKMIAHFNKIHGQLMKMHNLYIAKQPLPDVKQFLENVVYPTDDLITDFADGLQRQLQQGKVSIYEPVPPINPTKESEALKDQQLKDQ